MKNHDESQKKTTNLIPGDEFSLTQIFDRGSQFFILDLRPAIPLLVHDALVVQKVLVHGTSATEFSTDGSPILIIVFGSDFLK
jgi:hypothetical protein